MVTMFLCKLAYYEHKKAVDSGPGLGAGGAMEGTNLEAGVGEHEPPEVRKPPNR